MVLLLWLCLLSYTILGTAEPITTLSNIAQTGLNDGGYDKPILKNAAIFVLHTTDFAQSSLEWAGLLTISKVVGFGGYITSGALSGYAKAGSPKDAVFEAVCYGGIWSLREIIRLLENTKLGKNSILIQVGSEIMRAVDVVEFCKRGQYQGAKLKIN